MKKYLIECSDGILGIFNSKKELKKAFNKKAYSLNNLYSDLKDFDIVKIEYDSRIFDCDILFNDFYMFYKNDIENIIEYDKRLENKIIDKIIKKDFLLYK